MAPGIAPGGARCGKRTEDTRCSQFDLTGIAGQVETGRLPGHRINSAIDTARDPHWNGIDLTIEFDSHLVTLRLEQECVECRAGCLTGGTIEIGYLHLLEAQFTDKRAQTETTPIIRNPGLLCVAQLPVPTTFRIGFEQQVRRLEDQTEVQYPLQQRSQGQLPLNPAAAEPIGSRPLVAVGKTDVGCTEGQRGRQVNTEIAIDAVVAPGSRMDSVTDQGLEPLARDQVDRQYGGYQPANDQGNDE